MTDDRDASYVVRPTIPARYLLEMAARVPGGPGTLRRALARARLAPGALRIPGFRASVAQLELYYRALVREGGDELFGWFARPVPRGTYATLVRVLTACRDVGASVDASSCFYRLFDPHPYPTLKSPDGEKAHNPQ